MEDENQYGLRRPTASALEESIRKVLGEEEGSEVWNHALSVSGLDANSSLELEELRRVAEALSRMSGIPGVMGRAAIIRIDTYELLVRRMATT